MKISVCNEMFEGWEIEDVFRFAAQAGFDGVEIAPFTLAHSVEDISQTRRQEIRNVAADLHLDIVGLHWLLVSPEGLYINHPDAKIRAVTRDYLHALIDFCGDLGGKVMVLGSPKQRNVMADHTYEETWKWTREMFSDCALRAGDREVTLCMEALQPRDTNFINTLAEAAPLVEQIGHPSFRLMVDVCSASGAEEKPVDALIREFAPLIRHVHVNDANGCGPGFGEVDFVPILNALKQIGYEGYLSIEVFDFKPDPETIASKSLAYLRTCLSEATA